MRRVFRRAKVDAAPVVLRAGVTGDALMVKAPQDHIKTVMAPDKHPRRVVFADALPKTQTGKIQRFRFRLRLRNAQGRGRPRPTTAKG